MSHLAPERISPPIHLGIAWTIVISFSQLVQAGPVLFHEVDVLDAPGNAIQMEYSPQYGLLFLRNSGSAIHVIDTQTEQPIGIRFATDTFTDFDLTPDGRYLYAADYGGTRIGYGNPSRPSHVQRYDLQSRTWDSQTAPWVVFHIEGVSADRYLAQEIDQHVDMMLNSWGISNLELARISADYYGDFEYDHRLNRIYHGSSGSSSSEIHVRRLVGDSLLDGGNSGTYGTAQQGGGSVVLSSDGSRLYYGRLQVEALDVTNNTNMFPEVIYAATPDIAFGKSAYYSAKTGAKLGELGYLTSVYAVSDDGRDVWAFNPNDDTLHHYAVPELSSLTLATAAVLIGVAYVARARKYSSSN